MRTKINSAVLLRARYYIAKQISCTGLQIIYTYTRAAVIVGQAILLIHY